MMRVSDIGYSLDSGSLLLSVRLLISSGFVGSRRNFRTTQELKEFKLIHFGLAKPAAFSEPKKLPEDTSVKSYVVEILPSM